MSFHAATPLKLCMVFVDLSLANMLPKVHRVANPQLLNQLPANALRRHLWRKSRLHITAWFASRRLLSTVRAMSSVGQFGPTARDDGC